MSTESQINANRLNARKSTGPKTPEGKDKVAQNAVTHGLTAKQPVLDSENHEEYALFKEDFFSNYAPVGILEETLAQRAADTLWRLQRAQNYETAVLNTLIYDAQNPNDQLGGTFKRSLSVGSEDRQDNLSSILGGVLLDDFRTHRCLEKIQKYEMSIERSFFRTIKELRRLQSLRTNNVAEASRFGSIPENSINKENKPNPVQAKPKIPTFDPMKLLENCLTNPIGPDPLTKIMMQKTSFCPPARKVG